MPTAPYLNFPLPKTKARYPHLPNVRATTRVAIYTDCGTRVIDGETLAGWCVIARSLHGRIDVMFGPVITSETHCAFCGARAHSKNTAEMTAMIEALSFLGPVAQLPVIRIRVFIMTPNMLLVFALARFKPAHTCSWHLRVNSRC